jgi:hypothetical protein
MGLNGFIFNEINKNKNIKEKLKSWEPFRRGGGEKFVYG